MTKELFPYGRWRGRLGDLSRDYQQAKPFPNIRIDHFLEPEVACSLLREFPNPQDTSWIHYKHFNENKLGKTKREEFPHEIGRVIDEFNSPEFCAFLSELTGIKNLTADASLEGGGMHQTEPGGFLNMHADFTMHHHHKHWRRRVNLILYLNEGWKPEWRGELELWDREMKQCVTKIPPMLNTAAIFSTDETSHHGYPDPIRFPEGTTRKSLALYYYTVETSVECSAKSTNYKPRPSDGLKSSFLIWADKKVVHCYSVLKRTFGLSDDFASRWLGRLSRKKK